MILLRILEPSFVYLYYIAVISDLLQLKIQALIKPADNLLRMCDYSSLLV